MCIRDSTHTQAHGHFSENDFSSYVMIFFFVPEDKTQADLAPLEPNGSM